MADAPFSTRRVVAELLLSWHPCKLFFDNPHPQAQTYEHPQAQAYPDLGNRGIGGQRGDPGVQGLGPALGMAGSASAQSAAFLQARAGANRPLKRPMPGDDGGEDEGDVSKRARAAGVADAYGAAAQGADTSRPKGKGKEGAEGRESMSKSQMMDVMHLAGVDLVAEEAALDPQALWIVSAPFVSAARSSRRV